MIKLTTVNIFVTFLCLMISKSTGTMEDINVLTSPKTDFYSADFQSDVTPAIAEYEQNSSYFYFLLQQFLFLWYLWQVCIM